MGVSKREREGRREREREREGETETERGRGGEMYRGREVERIDTQEDTMVRRYDGACKYTVTYSPASWAVHVCLGQ